MTDKELAEEYRKDLKSKFFLSEPQLDLACQGYKDGFLAGLKAKTQWHKLSEKYPEADKLVRVRLMSGMEHICETCYYEPTEDEIGYGKLIINFYELDGEWVDDTDIIAWCEIPTFDKE
jgi:hypothetical protein